MEDPPRRATPLAALDVPSPGTSRLDVVSMMMSSVLASSVVAPSVVAPRARSAKRASVAVRASSEHKDATRREAMSLVAVRFLTSMRRVGRMNVAGIADRARGGRSNASGVCARVMDARRVMRDAGNFMRVVDGRARSARSASRVDGARV